MPRKRKIRGHRGLWSGIVTLLLFPVLQAQEILRPPSRILSDSLKISSISFDRVLNTFLWNGFLRFDQNAGGFDVSVDQNVRSRSIRTEQSALQDEYRGRIFVSSRLSEAWKARVDANSSILSDSRSIDLGRLAQHQVLGGLEYATQSGLVARALGGYEFNAQETERDEGIAYATDIVAEDLRLQEFQGTLQSSWSQSLIGKRKPHTGGLNFALYREFGAETSDSLVIHYSAQRREFYTVTDPSTQVALQIQQNIFAREAQVTDISNQIRYRLASDASLVLNGGILNRAIDRGYRYKNYENPSTVLLDTRIQEFLLHGSLFFRWEAAEWFRAGLGLSYEEREERHSVKEDPNISPARADSQKTSAGRLDNISRRTTLTAQIKSLLSEDDQMRLTSSGSILQYDTPDVNNIDDRDEILFALSAEEDHRFSRYLRMTLSVDVTLGHLVYLHRLQSANNNWNRIVRLSPCVEYELSERIKSVNRAEVLANYTVYDFEEQVASVKSFSFRQASWSDSTVIRLSKRIELEFLGSLRLFERGVLHWKDFKERPENYFVEKTVWPQIAYAAESGLRIAVGYRLFGQDRYRYEGGDRSFEQSIEASGPTARVEWKGVGYQSLTVEGWRETQKLDGQTTATISNLSMKITFLL